MLKSLAKLFGVSAQPAVLVPPVKPHVDDAPEAPLAEAAAAIAEGRKDAALALLEVLLQAHPEHAAAHILIGTLLHECKRYEDARDHYLLAACFKLDWWVPQFHLGLLALDEGRNADALEALTRAADFEAPDARVYNALGAARLYADDIAGAVEAFRQALTLQPDFAQAHSNLGYTLMRDLEEYEAGARHIAHALELAPLDQAVRCNWIMVLHHRGLHEDALALADELLASDPNLVEARVNRALMLLKQGHFAAAWDDYEARKDSPRSKITNDLPWPEWNGESLQGRSLFVYPEQGLGDEIMFASCLPDVISRARLCTVECHPKLERIFRRSFPTARVLARNTWRSDRMLDAEPPDCKVAIGSLPRRFRRTQSDFPAHRGYLKADAGRVEYWRARLAQLPGKCKVGISWRGGLASTRRSLRSIPLSAWQPILSLPGFDFVSLQYSDPEREIQAINDNGIVVHEWPAAIDDYDETAALVSAVDLVISVQTAIVHLAGALARPAWALIPAMPEWRYGSRGSTMLWYPSVKLVRQTALGEWGPVMQQVACDLHTWEARAR